MTNAISQNRNRAMRQSSLMGSMVNTARQTGSNHHAALAQTGSQSFGDFATGG